MGCENSTGKGIRVEPKPGYKEMRIPSNGGLQLWLQGYFRCYFSFLLKRIYEGLSGDKVKNKKMGEGHIIRRD